MNSNTTTWVLVADEAIARILERPADGGDLTPVEELTDPAAHARNADLRRDAEGRRAGSATHNAQPGTSHRLRSGASTTSSAGEGEQHLEAQGFAKRVAQRLDEALMQGRFDQLHLVAAPRFLGLLRRELGKATSQAVVGEIDKDFVHLVNSDITQRLFPPR